jgi:hypothetical protein
MSGSDFDVKLSSRIDPYRPVYCCKSALDQFIVGILWGRLWLRAKFSHSLAIDLGIE